MNAVEMMKQDEEDRRLHIIALTQERFIKNWQPDDDRMSQEFHRDFNYLLHLIYREAREPLTKQLTDIMMRMPMPHFIPERKP